MDSSVKNLIFDLGGVILDLSVDHTIQSFSDFSGMPKARVKELFQTTTAFEEFEKGLISVTEFREAVRKTYAVAVDDATFDAGWNAMLLGIPMKKLELLLSLKERFQVYLLSNTNDIHLSYINEQMLPSITGTNSLDPYFHRTYYSHHMKMRKPDAEIFEQVLNDNNLQPHQTLFLDDNADNIAGAKRLGIQTLHVLHPDQVMEYFHA
jgi:glucose-1-phosphatase